MLVLADQCLQLLGGDSLAQMRERADARVEALRARMRRAEER